MLKLFFVKSSKLTEYPQIIQNMPTFGCLIKKCGIKKEKVGLDG